MNDSIVYNIPAAMINAHRGRRLVVRSRDPSEIVHGLAAYDPEQVAYVQILGGGGNLDDLACWTKPIPVDLVVEHTETDLPLLYRFSPLLADRPVRVTVPVTPGFEKVVKLALSLDFVVKLEPSQPDPELVLELLRVADLYLHQSTVSQPVEFIHSVFLGFYHGRPISLWVVQEEEPNRFRFVTDQGEEFISKRFATLGLKPSLTSFMERSAAELRSDKYECGGCEFFEGCLGYFKLPRKDYRCDGIKALFRKLREAAEELKTDLSSPCSGSREKRS